MKVFVVFFLSPR